MRDAPHSPLLRLLEPLYESAVRPEALDLFLRLLADELRADVRVSADHELGVTAGVRHLLRVLGPVRVTSGSHPAFLSAVRSRRAPAFGAVETDMFGKLVPHMRRAMELRLRMTGLDPAVNPLAQAADGLPLGVILLRAPGAVLFANCEARRLLEQRDGLFLTPMGLRVAAPSEDRKLRLLIAAAVARQPSGRPACLPVSRPSLRPSFLLLVAPARPSGPRLKRETGLAVVFVRDPDRLAAAAPQAVIEAFHLTPAQARLAIRLCRGESLAELAAREGVALNTARVHLKAVFRKTRTRRQAELVGLLLRTCGSMAAPADSVGRPGSARR